MKIILDKKYNQQIQSRRRELFQSGRKIKKLKRLLNRRYFEYCGKSYINCGLYTRADLKELVKRQQLKAIVLSLEHKHRKAFEHYWIMVCIRDHLMK
jgi:hypothetical protein